MNFLVFTTLSLRFLSACAALNGTCVNHRWMGVYSCIGEAIEQFPALNYTITREIGHIDIVNTAIKTIPDFNNHSWPNLFTLDIRGNVYVNCSEVLNLQITRVDLIVLTDCDDGDGGQINFEVLRDYASYIITPKIKWMASLALVPLTVQTIIGLLLYYRKKYSSYRVPNTTRDI